MTSTDSNIISRIQEEAVRYAQRARFCQHDLSRIPDVLSSLGIDERETWLLGVAFELGNLSQSVSVLAGMCKAAQRESTQGQNDSQKSEDDGLVLGPPNKHGYARWTDPGSEGSLSAGQAQTTL